VANRAGIRASDADRERVAERLRHAAAEGRLLAHELEDRLATALRAQTYGELDAVVADLPGARVAKRSRSRSLARAHPIVAAIVVAIAAIVVLATVAVIVAVVLAAWWVWMILAWVLINRRQHRRGLYGPRRRGPIAGPPHAGPHAGTWL